MLVMFGSSGIRWIVSDDPPQGDTVDRLRRSTPRGYGGSSPTIHPKGNRSGWEKAALDNLILREFSLSGGYGGSSPTIHPKGIRWIVSDDPPQGDTVDRLRRSTPRGYGGPAMAGPPWGIRWTCHGRSTIPRNPLKSPKISPRFLYCCLVNNKGTE
jgi:hypothetical protein